METDLVYIFTFISAHFDMCSGYSRRLSGRKCLGFIILKKQLIYRRFLRFTYLCVRIVSKSNYTLINKQTVAKVVLLILA